MKKIFTLLTLFALSFAIFSCSDDDSVTNATFKPILPDGITTISNIEVKMTEKNSGIEYNFAAASTDLLDITVTPGIYDVEVSADGDNDIKLKGYSGNITFVNEIEDLNVTLFIYNSSNANFLISEIYFTGSLASDSKASNDRYFIITNNSDSTLYADSLVLCGSKFSCDQNDEYTPDIMSTDFTVSSMIMVPGDGKTYPIEAHQSFIIADDAVDFTELNPDACDLSIANFEIVWDSETSGDSDNPEVPNMINVVNNFTIHSRGLQSYAIGKIDKTIEEYVVDNKYTYSYEFIFGDFHKTMNQDAYKLSNDNIYDAVNLCVPTMFAWLVTDPSVDMGWTYCGAMNYDTERFDKSVIRKDAGTNVNGQVIYLDTNNSTTDFKAEVTPSLK
ncbi:MAG: DUF4876 domain-containing protein [Bacteroidales bacterium]